MNTDVFTQILAKIESPIVLGTMFFLIVFIMMFKTEISAKLFRKSREKRAHKIKDLRNHNVFITKILYFMCPLLTGLPK